MGEDVLKALKEKVEELQLSLDKARKEKDTALKELQEYKDKTLKAEKASKMKSLFLANMSHEIRTPLNAIEGFSRVIAETESSDDRMKFLEIVESNSNRLMSLINEILDLSKVESGEIQIKKKPVNLTELCNNIKQIFKFRCPEEVSLIVDAPQRNVILNTDENRLTQVFCNLISNALKHTIKGSITFGYHLSDDEEKVLFHVTDTGNGISAEDIGTIFQTYVSKDAETMNNGYGLGLPLCKIIVEKMSGRISVESTLGRGSRFTFFLPFDGELTQSNTTTRTSSNITRTLRSTPVTDLDKMKLVLVAEDEEFNYELVKNVLANRYRLIRAKNGIEAVTLNEDEKPDLILMDIRMPEMNGLDATRIIKEVNPDTPIIALSAFAFEDSIEEAKRAGCDDFMAKPFKVEALVEIIAKYIKQ